MTKKILVTVALAMTYCQGAAANSYNLPRNGDNVVGEVALATTARRDDMSDIAYAYDQGYEDMRSANPKVDFWLPGDGAEVVVPSQYILPDTPHEGIVINLPEMRLYYYPPTRPGQNHTVITYPVSIGPQDWKTPQGLTKVLAKKLNPPWIPPASIRAEHAKDGEVLPKIVPGGPDNPLGQYALTLGHAGYLIHGTNKPYGVGMRVTHGCMRLYPKDIERLYHQVSVGTPVRIVNQPFKVGSINGELFAEIHPYLEEDGMTDEVAFTRLTALVTKVAGARAADADWEGVRRILTEKSGIPKAIPAHDPEPESTTAGQVQDDRSLPVNTQGADVF